MNQPFNSRFCYEVQISEPTGSNGQLTGIYNALDWLDDNDYEQDIDYVIDMYGGSRKYCSIWFKNKTDALITKLTVGGQ